MRDPLTVTALALESGGDQCVMVSTDRVGIPEDILAGVREKLTGLAPDLPPEKVLISATHTHAAPGTDSGRHEDLGPDVMEPSDYGSLLIDRTATCVADAWNARASGAISWGCGQAVVGFNRRQVKLDGTSQMYGETATANFSHIEGYEDHGVDMLCTYGPDGALTGMLVNLACPSQVTESDHHVSADYWHETRCEIRRRHGNGLFILPQCSAAGDQSPHLMWKKRAELRMLELKGLCEDESGRLMAERTEIGRRIANAVDEVLPLVAKDIHHEAVLRHEVQIIQLPRRSITEDDVKDAEQEALSYERKLATLTDRPTSDAERSTCVSRARWFRSVIERHELQKTQPTYPMELHVVRVGDIAFATNAFELYLDYGLRMKTRSKALQTFVVQLTGSGTYLPSARSGGGGSYGSVPASNHVGPEGGDVLVEKTVKAINSLFDEE